MKVLIINDRPHQLSLLKGVSDNMKQYGIFVDIFVLNAGIFYSPKSISAPPPLLYIYRKLCKWKYPRILIGILFCKFLVYRMSNQYDAIDFQGLFVPAYRGIIYKLKAKYGKRIKVTIWGSDFYRQAGGTYKEKEVCYINTDIIQISTYQMKQDFIKIYPQFENKIRVAHFGLDKLEKLKLLILSQNRRETLETFGILDGDVVITCGYNGIPAQQHEIIIKAVEKLPLELRQNIFMILPMTYGTPPEYKKEIEEIIIKSQLKHFIIDKYISEEQLLQLRLRTDIAVNIQISDAFAGSIQEHLMAENLLVVGNWLPYHQIFEDNNIFVRYTEIDDLSQNIGWAIENYKLIKERLKNNSKAIYNFSSWKNASVKWADIYRELNEK